ncbi:MAG: DUF2087 domain-containing protein [Rhodobacteraceae bacterium]|nr:DUF2087 domain-containing protein [Paracoccaceae bacterium]
MSRDTFQVQITDLSKFAKSLRGELSNPPSHVEMLGLLARAAGYRNFQHLRAVNRPRPPVNHKKVTQAARYFDSAGKLKSWPQKTSVQHLCVWVVWAQLPPRLSMTERDISARINAFTVFRDPARIRRTLIEMKVFTRKIDGSDYRRVEQPMPADATALLDRIRSQK